MEQWDSSQLLLEKSTFDSINTSDKVLNLSKEGNKLTTRLQDCYQNISSGFDPEAANNMQTIILELQNTFQTIIEHASAANDISHFLEMEVAFQREVGDRMKDSVCHLCDSLDSATASAEFLLADL